MLELLAIPAWDTGPTLLTSWVEAFEGQGLAVLVVRESNQATWVEVDALRFRGYAVMDGIKVEAINFELTAPDPSAARQAIETAAAALAWEVNEEDDDDDE
jgi:hypothetical protein